jgi:5-methylcytosine-specific restriction endonuclease McrA
MAKEWALWFYRSPAWKRCRRLFLESKHWLCERCQQPARIAHHKTYLTQANVNDPYVTLHWSNLEALCEDCHNKEHFGRTGATREGFGFDSNGDLIERRSST